MAFGNTYLNRYSERSEESLLDLNQREIPRFARNDKLFGFIKNCEYQLSSMVYQLLRNLT
jgi:hypothetical protein